MIKYPSISDLKDWIPCDLGSSMTRIETCSVLV